jgi:hypothetical protein
MTSSAFDGLAASTTSQPLTGSIQVQTLLRIENARGSSSSATRSFSSFIAFLPGGKPCCSSSSAALALATWLMTEPGSSFFSVPSIISICLLTTWTSLPLPRGESQPWRSSSLLLAGVNACDCSASSICSGVNAHGAGRR